MIQHDLTFLACRLSRQRKVVGVKKKKQRIIIKQFERCYKIQYGEADLWKEIQEECKGRENWAYQYAVIEPGKKAHRES